MQASSKLKILVLHGHAMSGELMKQKLGAIRSETKKVADWYFPDGPIALPQGTKVPGSEPPTNSAPQEGVGETRVAPVDGATTSGEPSSPPATNSTPFVPRSWYDFSRIEALMDADPAEFDRLRQLPWGECRPLYDGMEVALQTVSDYAEKEGPFDGIFAFSQGAVVAAVLLAQLRLSALSQASSKSESTGRPSLPDAIQRAATHLPPISPKLHGVQFCILVSGLLPKDPFYSELVTCPALATAVPPLPVYSLHCWGRTDCIILPTQSIQLEEAAVFGPLPKTPQEELEVVKQVVSGPSKREETLLPMGGRRYLTTHEGGHVVASVLRKPIKEFLTKMASGSGPSSPTTSKGPGR